MNIDKCIIELVKMYILVFLKKYNDTMNAFITQLSIYMKDLSLLSPTSLASGLQLCFVTNSFVDYYLPFIFAKLLLI